MIKIMMSDSIPIFTSKTLLDATNPLMRTVAAIDEAW